MNTDWWVALIGVSLAIQGGWFAVAGIALLVIAGAVVLYGEAQTFRRLY